MLFINEPKHLVNPVRDIILFDNPFLEMFTRTPWYLIPLAYVPTIYYHLSLSNIEWEWTVVLLLGGILFWTFLEYFLHRWFFHSEDAWLPNHPLVLAHHFLIHGIHHAFPQDRWRLVFPVILGYQVYFGLVLPLVRSFCVSEY
jgi:4-hydroxysphinganine ceramide fatty acyl 2-hydroxylase